MKTIAVICEKGGVGKTVIAKELFYNFQKQGLAVSYFNIDGQYKNTNQSVIVDNADIAILDTPGNLTDQIHEVVKAADLIVVPIRAGGNDMEPMENTIGLIRENTNVPIIVVVNEMNRFLLAMNFMEWLTQQPWAEHIVTIPHAEAIGQASLMDKSVVDVERKFGPASLAIRNLCREVCSLAGLPYQAVPSAAEQKVKVSKKLPAI